ncbi:transposase [Candidatus Glomeribacter gigasporarum]|uniref:transposase n=1 Tax=Candidatus Glomeribacter gigasporarum TaxID=132144 RepID=UPI003B968E85
MRSSVVGRLGRPRALPSDSGKYRGKRFIEGGRALVRKTLYMAAFACTRWNQDLKTFYERLRALGKSAKVAFISVLRTLFSVLNSVVRRQSPRQEQLGKTA